MAAKKRIDVCSLLVVRWRDEVFVRCGLSGDCTGGICGRRASVRQCEGGVRRRRETSKEGMYRYVLYSTGSNGGGGARSERF